MRTERAGNTRHIPYSLTEELMATDGHAPMVITHEGGLQFAAQLRSHRLVVDQPIRAGGKDTGPMPIELLGAALGTCVALYVHQFCWSRGISTEGLRIEVEQFAAANPNRIGQFIVRVVMPNEVPEQYASLLERVVRSCPAHHTLEMGAVVAVEIETPAGKA